jgi:hypothetical protein
VTRELSRRHALRATGSALGSAGLCGCLFGIDEEYDAGTLVVRNDYSELRTVTVTVTKTSGDSGDTRHHEEPPAPETTPLWRREKQFDVGSGEKAVREQYVAEPGAFYLEARLESGGRHTAWLGLYEAADGDDVGADAVFVDVNEDSRVMITTTHGD